MNIPSGGSKVPDGPTEPIGARHSRPQSSTRRKQDRRRALIISCGMLLVGAVAIVGMVTVKTPKAMQVSSSPVTAQGGPDGDLRTAKITKASDGNGCSQEIFDNQTGRMNRSQQPCEATAYDSHGAPVPVGTIHRLDAISKSFAGH
jgi:hypothetical protein